MIRLFDRFRPTDTNIHALISNKEEEAIFHISDEDKVSSMDKDFVKNSGWHYPEALQIKLKTHTLNAILDKHLPAGQKIDFMSIDIEGHDLQALQSLDLEKYRPHFIVIEMHNTSLENIQENAVFQLLKHADYRLENFALINGFFVDARTGK